MQAWQAITGPRQTLILAQLTTIEVGPRPMAQAPPPFFLFQAPSLARNILPVPKSTQEWYSITWAILPVGERPFEQDSIHHVAPLFNLFR